MLLSGLPPLVRDGDRFRAGFTVRNAGARPLAVTVTARATTGGSPLPALEPRDLELAPGQARETSWDLAVPASATALDWQVDAIERGAPPKATAVRDSAQGVAARGARRAGAHVPGHDPAGEGAAGGPGAAARSTPSPAAAA